MTLTIGVRVQSGAQPEDPRPPVRDEGTLRLVQRRGRPCSLGATDTIFSPALSLPFHGSRLHDASSRSDGTGRTDGI